jgi:two-component system sensor histidine kinase DctS/two-component system sensor kinase FixL
MIKNSQQENQFQGFTQEDLGEKFEMLTNTSPDCIKLFNLENKIEFMSPGGLKEHGFKNLQAAIGFDWTESIVPEQREEVLRKIKESVQEKKTVCLDVKHLPEYADREWCSLSISPVFDKKGAVKYFIGVSRDISDRKLMEEQIKKHSDEQESVNKMMVDRELKMIKLKKENDELKKSLRKK